MRIDFEKKNFANAHNITFCYVVNNRIKQIPMTEENQYWYVELALNDGIYLYKFIIDEGLKLNDCNAKEYIKWINDEIWSVLHVPYNRNCAICETEMNIIGYSMTPGVRYGLFFSNHEFSLFRDKKYSISMEIDGVCGVHSVTAVWYREDKSIYHIEERNIEFNEINKKIRINLVFWVNLPNCIDTKRNWEVEIFIDGKITIKDYFIGKKYEGVNRIICQI